MATAKKPATKRSTVKKTPAKKTTPAKTHRKTSSKKVSTPEMRSFKLAKDVPPFRTFKLSRQTVYWVILVSFIIFAQLWIIKLQVDVANLIEIQQNELMNNN